MKKLEVDKITENLSQKIAGFYTPVWNVYIFELQKWPIWKLERIAYYTELALIENPII